MLSRRHVPRRALARRGATLRRGAPLRRGATLVELLVALLLAGVVVAAVARSRASSHTAGSDALARAEARRQLRAGAGAVLATLRGIAPAGGDLLALADSALELHITLGASVLCAHAPAGLDTPPSAVLLAPAGAREGTAAWADAPDAGDRLLVMARDADGPNAGDSVPPAPARWRWYAATVADGGTPVRTTCMGAADALALRVPLAAPLPAIVHVGAPVRLLRRGRWSVYRSGRRWYLGWRDVDAGGAGLDVVQPVSGPHDLAAGSGAPRPALAFGDAIRARDDAGATEGAVPRLAQVRAVSLRAQAPAVRADGAAVAESLAIAGAFRNAPALPAP